MFKIIASSTRFLRFAGVTATAGALVLTGCGQGQESPPTMAPTTTESASPQPPEPSDSPSETPSDTPSETPSESPSGEPGSGLNVETSVATYQAQGEVWPTAALEGSLMLLDTGCLVVREAQGENAFIPVFPISHESVTFDGQTLRLGVTSFEVGDKITLGGSALEWSDSFPELNYTMPAACHDLDTWWASPTGM
ncbi:hypothetical protein V5R04_00510 [Jonesiaceae bacterium BS-20]|uniref:Uncharacterized protein n=1 Tax=Jonesiaceae bacterium BS-20 TaxID=3120821 RepID=A0AAU7DV80_9MICO